MQHKTTRLTGANGALPAWVNLANTIFQERDYAASLDLADLAFAGVSEVPLQFKDIGQQLVAVSDEKGGIPMGGSQEKAAPSQGGAVVRTFATRNEQGELVLERLFKPYWNVEEN
jgi:hypothetical protein